MIQFGTLNRRAFLSRSSQTFAALTLGGSVLGAVEKSKSGYALAGEQARGIAAGPLGQVAVAIDREVQLFDSGGKIVRRIPAEGAVRAVTFGPDGRLWLALKDRIGGYDNGELKMLPARLGRAAVITSLAVGSNREVFAADSGSKTVLMLAADGSVKKRITPSDAGFIVSKAFFPIECHGRRLFVAEPGRHRIHVYDLTGRPLTRWGVRSRQEAGFAGCCNPVGIAVTGEGKVITAERGRPRIKAFAGNGDYERELAGPDRFPSRPEIASAAADVLTGCLDGGVDVAVGPGNRVLVLDRALCEIREIV